MNNDIACFPSRARTSPVNEGFLFDGTILWSVGGAVNNQYRPHAIRPAQKGAFGERTLRTIRP